MTVLIFVLKIKPPVNASTPLDEIVGGIMSHVHALDPQRKEMFYVWLHAHSSQVKQSGDIQMGLKSWFGSMPAQSVQWEYYLILKEIKWLLDQSRENIDLLRSDYVTEGKP